MRRTAIAALLVGGLLVTACGDDDAETADTSDASAPDGTAPAGTEPTGTSETSGGDCATGLTLDEGTLTVATGEPAFEPWVIGDAPESGEGFEAAVAYAVAERWASPTTR